MQYIYLITIKVKVINILFEKMVMKFLKIFKIIKFKYINSLLLKNNKLTKYLKCVKKNYLILINFKFYLVYIINRKLIFLINNRN